MSNELTLYSYWRSSAAWRVRIALNLKGMDHALTPVHLLRDGGEHRSAIFRELNPQALIPILIDGDRVIRQSLAIIEYLEEAYPETPRLLPIDNRSRARVRAIAQMVACDIHPLGNLRVQQYLEEEFAAGEAQRQAWTQHWIVAGFDALEAVLAGHPGTGTFCEGDAPTLADCCLVPQIYNARRFGVDMAPYPVVARIGATCDSLQAFKTAAPEAQADAPASA